MMEFIHGTARVVMVVALADAIYRDDRWVLVLAIIAAAKAFSALVTYLLAYHYIRTEHPRDGEAKAHGFARFRVRMSLQGFLGWLP